MTLPEAEDGSRRVMGGGILLGLATLLAGCAATNTPMTPQPRDYPAVLVAEDQRRELPTLVRNELPAGVRDAIERNPLVQSSPPARARFAMRWTNEATLPGGVLHRWITQLECEPVAAGYLRCSELASANGGGVQSLHAQGGLATLTRTSLPSVLGSPGEPDGFNAFLLRARKAGPLPEQDLDFISTLYRPGVRDRVTTWTRCTPQGPVEPVPPVLQPLGPVRQLRCDTQVLDARTWAPLQPPVSARYYWLQRGAIALPSVLFMRSPDRSDFAGYTGPWRLLGHATKIDGFRLLPAS